MNTQLHQQDIDERQQYIRGKIFIQASLGMMVLMILLAFLDSFKVIRINEYMDTADLLINLVIVYITYLSCALIWKDAYFGVLSSSRMKACLYIFIVLAVAEDVLTVLDIIQGEAISVTSVLAIVMANSIAVSLWCKRKDWKEA